MSKKLKVLISTVVVALLLTVCATATVMAQGEEETTPTSAEAGGKGLLERVAEILGIDEEDLTAAFKQARQEMREDAFVSRLDEAVKEGYITQEQADEIIEWWEQRPDDAIRDWWKQKPEVIKPGMVERALPRLHMQNGLGGWLCPRLPKQAD